MCFQYNGVWNEFPVLYNDHEEADTRMLLHAKDANENNYDKIVIQTPDTDVFVLMLCFSFQTGGLCMKTGRGNRKRIINIDRVKQRLSSDLEDNVDLDDFCEALVGLNAFTGCDSVSCFAGKGKAKALNMLKRNKDFMENFKKLGTEWSTSNETRDGLEKFFCELYGGGGENKINNLRYKIYCARRGKLECEQLPPCHHSLLKHIERANYQTRIWRLSLRNNQNVESPNGRGWKLSEDVHQQFLEIDWFGLVWIGLV